ncbi:acyl-CoA dehydrogenase [Epidermidibacterium keratini]|uniref:Acyl-[acyl-carrier-protein] dehydrogenase MbtN n=1 Tax=Epidermidibacterium keratini TaxID=1891644 RepID=A0A7L4YM26_9ACTN|nr:acyl-CoA dehydrogenase family protein [Epidermidibacterium keratini]QHC00128.1 acyl-CoA dehydrogenase [Epidermidibacterium keratini]
MKRTIFSPEHDAFRETVREFLNREVAPRYDDWERLGYVEKDIYPKLAETGATTFGIPEEYGGAGDVGFKFNVVLAEELAGSGLQLNTYNITYNIILPYLMNLATDEQKARWLPKLAAGELVMAIAMTEPGTGSDLAGIRTSAVRDGDDYIVNGSKTFITGGSQADLTIVVTRTSPAPEENRRLGLSLLVVDTTDPGFAVGRRLDKIGLKSSDTCEISFTDVRVPSSDLLGEEGMAFAHLSQNLPRERLAIALGACATARAAIAHAAAYARDRQVFERPLSTFQNTKFVLAECLTELEAAQAMVDKAIELDEEHQLSAVDAAKCKLFATEMSGRVIDKCLQVHGGYGYILEYPIAKLYADARINRIFGGTSEVMKTIIAKDAGL